MFLVLLAGLGGCGAPPAPPAAPAAPPPQAPAVPGGLVDATAPTGSLFFTSDGKLVAAGAGRLVAFDPIARKRLGEVSLDSGSIPNPRSRPGVGERLEWTVAHAVWAWDGDSLVGVVKLGAQGDALRGLALWRPAAGLPTAITGQAGASCEPMALSRDRKAVAVRIDTSARGCGPWQTGVQVFSLETSRASSPPLELGITRAAAFSFDGGYVAAAGERALQVMDLRSGALVATLPIRSAVGALAFHPDARTLAWTNDDGELTSWEIGAAAPVARGAGQGIAFSADRRYAATLRAGRVTLLDAATFSVLQTLDDGVIDPFAATSTLVFSDDGALLAVARGGGQVSSWQLKPGAAAASIGPWLTALQPLPIPAPAPSPKIALHGRVAGRVLVEGRPLTNAEVKLVPHHQEYDDARALPPLTVRTKADGAYLLENVPAITWQVTVTAAGTTASGYIAELREKKVVEQVVTLEPAATIRGLVVGPNRVPVRGAVVFHAQTYSVNEHVVATDAGGRFQIDHLRPGQPYAVTVRGADGAAGSASFDISKPGPVDAVLALLAPGDAKVVHFLVQDQSGAAVAGARVSVEGQTAMADELGRASLAIDASIAGGVELQAMVLRGDGSSLSNSTRFRLPQQAPIKLVTWR